MRYLNLFHGLMIALLSSGLGLCTKDFYEGSEPRLLVRVCDLSDSRYGIECTVFLGGDADPTVAVEVNTNKPWYIDDLSIYEIPEWCSVSLPSGILTGSGTDKSLTFSLKANHELFATHTFDLILRLASDPEVKVTIHVHLNANAEENN